jgi:cyclohexyl-isocyanide hydratase
MKQQRRVFLSLLGMAGGGLAVADAGEAAGSDTFATPTHDMSAFPTSWTGKEQIAMLLYPGFTALDLVGPQYMLGNLMGATIHLAAQTMAPVMSDTALAIAPTLTLADCPNELDVLFVPGGGQGTLQAMRDKTLVRWIADRGARAKLVASVCTGSLLLGQAGLLRGKRATSHWATKDLLPEFGARPVNARCVWDGKVLTGAGVSAGLDLGLSILGKLRDDEFAQCIQLLAEYAPKPPYRSGTPEQATPRVHRLMGDMFDGLREQVRTTAKDALG